MNVLSLFDGISCGRVALERAGIQVDNYYASEIDKHAIKVTQSNYPDTIQLGDVNNWESWDLPQIDLVMGGSPCQGLSFAGKSVDGKRVDFEDHRSKLFFKFVECLEHFQPKYFLLENVRMNKESLDIISDRLGVDPQIINSNLVSAQNRSRVYWTNFPYIYLLQEKPVYLENIIQENVPYFYYVAPGKSLWSANFGVLSGDGDFTRFQSFENINTPFLVQRPRGKNRGGIKAINGKTPTLTTGGWATDNLLYEDNYLRKLTPVECERLQTLPDGYTQSVSNAQRYKAIGNGWTVDVIAHILKGIK